MVAAQAADGTPVRVPTVVVGNAAASTAMTLDAVLQPVRQATVTAQVGGNVLALRVKPGDRVRRGQPLVRLDDREVRANTARSDAAVAAGRSRTAQCAAGPGAQPGTQEGRIHQPGGGRQLPTTRCWQPRRPCARRRRRARRPPWPRASPIWWRRSTRWCWPPMWRPATWRCLAGPWSRCTSRVACAPWRRSARRGPPLPAAATEVRVVLADGQRFTPSAREMLPTADPVSQTVEWRLTLPASAPHCARARPRRCRCARPVRRLRPPAESAGAAVLRRGELTAVYVAGPQGFALRAVRVGPAVGGVVDVLSGLRAGERVAMDPVRAGLQGASADGQ
jgi:pyruvate/2-oxoglutarate dehydrogenase complex dihydrolipoamide acyltransferase (E2) component